MNFSRVVGLKPAFFLLNGETQKIAGKILSPKARSVWDVLDAKTRSDVRKGNPFKYDRDRAICKLRDRGLRAEIVAELSGLNRASVFRIWQKERRLPGKQREEIRALAVSFNQVLKSIIRLLNASPGHRNR